MNIIKLTLAAATLSVGVACGVVGETPRALLERAAAALKRAARKMGLRLA